MKKPGIEFEEHIASRLREVEDWANPTINSGAFFGDEDARSPNYIIQAKDTKDPGKRNFIIAEDDWNQLQAAALRERTPDGNYKVGLFWVRNCHGKIIVALDVEDFLGLLEERKELLERIHELDTELEGIFQCDECGLRHSTDTAWIVDGRSICYSCFHARWWSCPGCDSNNLLTTSTCRQCGHDRDTHLEDVGYGESSLESAAKYDDERSGQ